MDNKIQNVLSNILKNNELSNVLIVGDSHMILLENLFKKKKIWDLNLSLLKKKINFVAIKGSSISGILKKQSKTNIRQKMDEKLNKNKKINTIIFALGFNDLHSIFPYKKIKNEHLKIKDFIGELLIKYKKFLKSYKKKKYKILVQSVMPLLPMKNMELYENFLKRYDLEDLKQENKEYIFNNYDEILIYYNEELRKICKNNNFYFFDNSKIHALLKKYDKYILSKKQKKDEFHYKPLYYLIIFANNIKEYFTNYNTKDINILLKDLKKFLKNDKDFHNFTNKISDNLIELYFDKFIMVRNDNFEIKLNKFPKTYFNDKSIFDEVQILSQKINKLIVYKNNTEEFVDKLFRQLFYKLPTQIFRYYTKGYVIFKLAKNNKLYFSKSYQNEFKRYHINKSKRKFKNIHFQMNCRDIFESLFIDKLKEEIKGINDYDKFRYKLINKINIKKLTYTYDLLEKGGNLVIENISYKYDEAIDFLYLLLLLFKKIMFTGRYIIGFNFAPKIKKEKLEELITKKFIIEPKHNLNKLEKFLKNIFNFNKILLRKFFEKDYENLLNIYFIKYIDFITKYFIDIDKKDFENIIINLKNILNRILDNNKLDLLLILKTTIGKNKLEFLKKFINENKIKNCLEFGCGLGIYSINILNSNKKILLTSIDTEQIKKWKSAGLNLISKLKFEDRFELIDKSVVRKINNYIKQDKKFGLIFINEQDIKVVFSNYFDFINKLLKINGYILINNLYINQFKIKIGKRLFRNFKVTEDIKTNFLIMEKIK